MQFLLGFLLSSAVLLGFLLSSAVLRGFPAFECSSSGAVLRGFLLSSAVLRGFLLSSAVLRVHFLGVSSFRVLRSLQFGRCSSVAATVRWRRMAPYAQLVYIYISLSPVADSDVATVPEG